MSKIKEEIVIVFFFKSISKKSIRLRLNKKVLFCFLKALKLKSNEGKKKIFVTKPTSTPIVETSPNSDKPLYSVGINDKKPIIDVIPTIIIDREISFVEDIIFFVL